MVKKKDEKEVNIQINEERMQEFMERFEKEIFPVMIGEDGKGLERFKAILNEKRKHVEERKREREQNFKKEGGEVQ